MATIEWHKTQEEEEQSELEDYIAFYQLPDKEKCQTLIYLMTLDCRDENGNFLPGYMDNQKKIIEW